MQQLLCPVRLNKKTNKIYKGMKTKVLFFIISILLVSANGFAQKNTIKGDGNIVTKEIAISNYDEMSYVGRMDIEYEQSDAAPYLKIMVDENILPYLDIKVKGKTLIIQPKNEKKFYDEFSHSLNLQPTVCEITTNSRELKDISAVGGGEFIAKTPLKVDRLYISIAGSSSINFENLLEARKIDFNVAGSGDINATQLKVDHLDCSVAGSGNILLKGEAERGDMSVAGGGDISAFDCTIRKAECSVAGGGNIKVFATEQLDASIAGGGHIRYKGDPEVSKSVIGGGSIKNN